MNDPVKKYIHKHDSPYVNAGVVTLQAIVKPPYERDSDVGYYVPSRSIVFTYSDNKNKKKQDSVAPYAFSSCAPYVKNGNGDYDEGASKKAFGADPGDRHDTEIFDSIKVLGVAIDGVENARDAKQFSNECGRLAIAIHGAVSVFCDTSNLDKPKYGDRIYALPISMGGYMNHGKDEYSFCGVINESPNTRPIVDDVHLRFLLGTYWNTMEMNYVFT